MRSEYEAGFERHSRYPADGWGFVLICSVVGLRGFKKAAVKLPALKDEGSPLRECFAGGERYLFLLDII